MKANRGRKKLEREEIKISEKEERREVRSEGCMKGRK